MSAHGTDEHYSGLWEALREEDTLILHTCMYVNVTDYWMNVGVAYGKH